MATPQRHLSPAEHRQIASESHLLVLDGLACKTSWSVEDVVFQGGTSLALAWNSPRFSEDLDFVARNDLKLSEAMQTIGQHVQEKLNEKYPGAIVEIKEKGEGQNSNFMVAVSLPNVLGKVKIKTEFWKVDNEHIQSYDGSIKEVAARGNITPTVPVASPDQIFADKMVALGARPRLKWRDVFDVWYLDGIGHANVAQNPQQFITYFENTLAMYNTAPDDVKHKWQELLNTPNDELVQLASRDLQPWISQQLWETLEGNKVEQMVVNLKTKLTEALNVFPPEEYTHMTSEQFKQRVKDKRAQRVQSTHTLAPSSSI